ncbi:MAG: type II CAAX prenyl endopeptidase Rce1 family protein [Bacilli bacterium]
MKKIYNQGELSFSILLIIIYLVVSFILKSSFGIDGIITLIGLLILSFIIIKFIYDNKLNKYYGLVKVKKCKKYLFFIPLFILCMCNLYNAKLITSVNSFIYILNMMVCGFLEVIILYGFLFKSLYKKRKVKSILIISVIFGFKNIFNILNGIDPVYCILNTIGMFSIGWLYATIIVKSKSIIPSIISNAILSSFTIYVSTSYLVSIISTIIILILSITYIVYLEKKC